MRIYAMNGAGNAFVLLDRRGDRTPMTPGAADVRAAHAAHAFDQFIVLEDAEAALSLRFWNADGGEAGACGNGARAAAWLVFQDGGADRVAFETRGGRLTAHRTPGGGAEVDMGPPRFDWREIPLARAADTKALDFAATEGSVRVEAPGAVSMGNPHAVFFVEDVSRTPVEALGPIIEHDPLFPERVNAGFAQVRARDRIRLRVWERGAGLTRACGTGACAALAAANRRGLAGREAIIEADGGELPVRWDRRDHIHLGGPVELERELGLRDLGPPGL